MVSHLIAHSWVGIDLQGVIVCCAVLEQSIVRVEHLLKIVDVTRSHKEQVSTYFREEVEPFPSDTTIVKTNLYTGKIEAGGKHSMMMALPLRQTLSRAWFSRCPPCWMVWSEPETNGYKTRAPPLLKWAFWDEKYVINKTWRYESSRIVLRRTWFEKDKTSVQCVVCTPKVKRQRNLNFDLVWNVAWLF